MPLKDIRIMPYDSSVEECLTCKENTGACGFHPEECPYFLPCPPKKKRRGTPLHWLQQWRQSHALTQADAARLFNVHWVTYAKWELGERPLTGAALRLAAVLQEPQGLRLVQRVVAQVSPAPSPPAASSTPAPDYPIPCAGAGASWPTLPLPPIGHARVMRQALATG